MRGHLFFIFITILYMIPPGLNDILYSSARFPAMRAEFPFGISYAKFLLTKADLYIAPLFPEIQKRTYAKFLLTKVDLYIGPLFLVTDIGRNLSILHVYAKNLLTLDLTCTLTRLKPTPRTGIVRQPNGQE